MVINEYSQAVAYGYLVFLGVLTVWSSFFDRHMGISLVLGMLYTTAGVRGMYARRTTLIPARQARRVDL